MEVVAGVVGLAPGQGRRGCASVASQPWVAGKAVGTAYPAGGHSALSSWSGLLWGVPNSPPTPQWALARGGEQTP